MSQAQPSDPNSLKEGAMWHVDPLLDNDREVSKIQQALLSNGFANKHLCMATVRNQQRNGVFCVVDAEML
jgi:hypothetical protein